MAALAAAVREPALAAAAAVVLPPELVQPSHLVGGIQGMVETFRQTEKRAERVCTALTGMRAEECTFLALSLRT